VDVSQCRICYIWTNRCQTPCSTFWIPLSWTVFLHFWRSFWSRSSKIIAARCQCFFHSPHQMPASKVRIAGAFLPDWSHPRNLPTRYSCANLSRTDCWIASYPKIHLELLQFKLTFHRKALLGMFAAQQTAELCPSKRLLWQSNHHQKVSIRDLDLIPALPFEDILRSIQRVLLFCERRRSNERLESRSHPLTQIWHWAFPVFILRKKVCAIQIWAVLKPLSWKYPLVEARHPNLNWKSKLREVSQKHAQFPFCTLF